MEMNNEYDEAQAVGRRLFEYRDYTPIPLILLLFVVARPTVVSATLGTLLIIAGEMFRLYAVAFIGAISRTRKESLGDELITHGPFAWVRNPLYIANFFIAIGFAVFSGRLWFMALTGILFAAQYYYIVKYEESLLVAKFGEVYRAYQQQVPGWWPNRLPSFDEMAWPKDLPLACHSEKRTLTALAAVLILLLIFVG